MKDIKYLLAVFISGLVIGFLGPLIKLIGNDMSGFTITFFRMVIAAFTLAVFLYFYEPKAFKCSGAELKHFAVLGLLMSLAFTLFAVAVLFAPVANVILLQSTYILFTAFFSFVFLREKITTRQILAVFIALFGIWLMNPFRSEFYFGNSLALAQGVVFGLFLVYLRRESKHNIGFKTMFWPFVFSSIYLAPFVFYFGVGDVHNYWIYLIILGVVSTAFSYVTLNYGLKKITAEVSAIIILVTFTLSSIILAYLLLGETITKPVLYGGSFLFIAALIAIWKYNIKKFLHAH